MNILKGHKRKTAWLLIAALILTLIPLEGWNPFTSSALVVGSDVDGNIVVNDVKFSKQHNGFGVVGGYIEIGGTNLSGVSAKFEFPGVGFVSAGTFSPTSDDFFIKYSFTGQEARDFMGRIRIGSQTINLNTSNFPNIQSADKLVVNQDDPDISNDITFSGNFLMRINNGVTGTFGRGISTNSLGTAINDSSLKLNNPTAPGQKGYQDILLREAVAATGTAPAIEVEYYYSAAFRIIQNLTLTNLKMFPNAAAKGDTIYFTADDFNDSKTYDVYFLGSGETFTTTNKSPSVVLSGDKARLTVQVPNNSTIPLGTKTVKIVETQNGEIVAEKTVTDPFNLIDASYKPLIDRINPATGPDTGSPVQIKGSNLLTLNLPNLAGYTGIQSVDYSGADDQQMDITYKNTGLKFQGVTVNTAVRNIKVIIGKEAGFERDNGAVKYQAGTDDYVYVVTGRIDDAESDPQKDVVMEITTTLNTTGGSYVFNQTATVPDGYTFVPSSIEPTITEVNPPKIHIDTNRNMKENTLLSIEGTGFFVNKYTDSQGKVHVNYPTVLIQNSDALGTGSFQFLFDKNGDPNAQTGRIYVNSAYLDEDDPVGSPGTYLLNGAAAVPVDMVVLDSNGAVVDGTVGNEIGTRIVLYLPTQVRMDAGGKKNIQVINPNRDSDYLGDEGIALDILDFVQATDTPVIEAVSPNIVTVEGGDTVTVTGSNFQEGAKAYIDGVEVPGVTRTIDVQGNKVVLTFKAPKGRLGKTQLAILNPLGGLAVRDFYYVLSFNKDPKITTVAPDKGTVDTLVVLEGDNFFKPDPTVQTSLGMDAFRLLGTRVILDGVDVNRYNKDALDNVEFLNYASPANQPLFAPVAGKVSTTPLYQNAYITDEDDEKVYKLQFDSSGNPVIYDGDVPLYTIRNASGTLHAYDNAGADLGVVTIDTDSIAFGTTTLNVTMNNNILAIGRDSLGKYKVQVANYAHSVVFAGPAGSNEFYTVEEMFDGTVRLSNGQLGKYTVKLDSAANPTKLIVVRDSGGTHDLSVAGTTLTFNGIILQMKTPYIKDGSNIITGNRTKVISKNQIIFTVPLLSTGQGFKNVAVENPDTKRDTKVNGFFYYASPATKPAISAIIPDKGSVGGGFLITLIGKDFEETSRVFIDGVEVPDADTSVNLDGTQLVVKVPAYSKDLADYGTDHISVPVVVLNQDGGSTSKANGFTYVNPASAPKLNSMVLTSGSTNGGEIVELLGYDFRYFEPYKDTTGGSGYDLTDEFTNLNSYLNSTWDSLTTSSGVLLEPANFVNNATYSFYTQYFKSPILPKVYFGTKEAQVVDFANGYLKVVTPSNAAGVVDVYVVNNDSGISNKLKYTYQSSNPQVTYINPTQGARIGQETRDIYGQRFAESTVPGYDNDNDSVITSPMDGVEVLVRFADISNRNIVLGQTNDGRINAERSTVQLEGNLSVEYRGDLNRVNVSLQENGKIYTRSFTNYDDRKLLIPAGMLKAGPDEYYVPNGYSNTGAAYNAATHYELFMVEVDPVAKRFYVERGYAPKTTLDSATHVVLDTPSYYTVGEVNVTLTNPDGGIAKTKYTYRNPASKPTIHLIKPQVQILDENAYMVEATVKGGITIEIKGHDFREGVKVYLDKTPMEVMDITVDNTTPSDPLDVIIAKVPVGKEADIGSRFPIIIENTDGGIANSTDPKTLTSATKWPIYFIYRKPLSGPEILTITPSKSSIYIFPNTSPAHGNEITVTGTDFRSGAMVIIGSIGGVPVTPHYIEDRGRILKFYIPPNLTVGPKDIQIINTDFGTGTKASGLEIISYPKISDIKAENGTSAVEWVSVEGGTKICINGSGFDAGAKVYFGGARTQLIAGDASATSGLWRDNNYYAVTGGTAATAVTFIDSTALTVTVPQVFKEKEFTITIINGDTGISDGDTTIKYSVPVPSAPLNLDAEIVNNKYIKLFSYTSSNFDYFEIYTFIGNKSVAKLEDNDYKDFHYVATAQTEPYKLTRLEGLEEMDEDDRVFIVLKAVNKYGPSSWSNIAYLKFSEIDDIKGGLGVEDFDGNLDVPAGQAFGTEVSAQQAIVTISKTDLRNMTTIPMTDSRFIAVQKTVVNIPETVVTGNYNLITLQMKQGRIRFYPAILSTMRFQQIAGGDGVDTYGNLFFEPLTTDYAGLIQRYIPRGMKAYSQPYRVGASAASNAGTTELTELTGSMEVALTYQSPLPLTVNPAALKLYWYDAAASRWVLQNSSLDTLNRQVASQVSRPGIYIVMGPR